MNNVDTENDVNLPPGWVMGLYLITWFTSILWQTLLSIVIPFDRLVPYMLGLEVLLIIAFRVVGSKIKQPLWLRKTLRHIIVYAAFVIVVILIGVALPIIASWILPAPKPI